MLGFHVGSESTHKTSGYGGHPMNIHVHRWTAPALTDLAVAAGFTPYPLDFAAEDRLLFASGASSSSLPGAQGIG